MVIPRLRVNRKSKINKNKNKINIPLLFVETISAKDSRTIVQVILKGKCLTFVEESELCFCLSFTFRDLGHF